MPMLSSLRRIVIDPPTASSADVERGVFWFAAAARDHVRAVAPRGQDGAVIGPRDFELDIVRLDPRTPQRTAAGAHHTVLHVVAGRVRVIANGRVTELASRDTQLVPPATTLIREAIGADARVVEIRYARSADVARAGVARRSAMTALRERAPARFLPALHDILSPHTLYPVIGSTTWGPGRFAVRGPSQLSIGLATTPRDTGPALHVHRYSTEMFVVLAGRFRITWGDRGEHATLLDPLDVIVVPRGVNRTFTAVGDADNWLMPIVVGADHEADDIVFLRDVESRLRGVAPRVIVSLLELAGLRIGERRAHGPS